MQYTKAFNVKVFDNPGRKSNTAETPNALFLASKKRKNE